MFTVFCYVFFCSLSLVGPGHVLIAAYDERTCSQLRDVSTTSYTEDYFVPDNLLTTEEVLYFWVSKVKKKATQALCLLFIDISGKN